MSRTQSKATGGPVLVLVGAIRAAAGILLVGAGGQLPAATVDDLYLAQVPAAGYSGPPLDDAFSRALDAVLVKVTGQRYPAGSPGSRQSLEPAAQLVRQYQPVPGGEIRVSFEPVALRRRLDAANLPVWADDRPRTLILLPGEGAADPMATAAGGPGGAAQVLLAAAAARGLSVLVASDDPGGPSGGPGPQPDPAARARAAGADLLLLARRVPTAGAAAYRWTLFQGADRAEWQGDLAEGVNGLADRLAARYATAAADSQELRLRVEGVDSFDAYGRLQSYLRGVGLVQSAVLETTAGSSFLFRLAVRGDAGQLGDAFALQRVLEPVAAAGPDAGPGALDTGAPQLVYRLAGGP